MRKHLVLAALFLIAIALQAGPSVAQVTEAQATAFFESFDTQALSGRGPDINAVYLPGVAAPTAAQLKTAQEKYATDLNEVMAASAARYAIEVVTAAGEMPTAGADEGLGRCAEKGHGQRRAGPCVHPAIHHHEEIFPQQGGRRDRFRKSANGDEPVRQRKAACDGRAGHPRNGPALELVQLEERRRSGHPGECAEGDVDLSCPA
jgi:hypothetical protein